jgi:hypothetical protein
MALPAPPIASCFALSVAWPAFAVRQPLKCHHTSTDHCKLTCDESAPPPSRGSLSHARPGSARSRSSPWVCACEGQKVVIPTQGGTQGISPATRSKARTVKVLQPAVPAFLCLHSTHQLHAFDSQQGHPHASNRNPLGDERPKLRCYGQRSGGPKKSSRPRASMLSDHRDRASASSSDVTGGDRDSGREAISGRVAVCHPCPDSVPGHAAAAPAPAAATL